jgi:choline-sulfatase
VRRSIPLPVIACLSAALAACQAREAPSRTPERPNILLVTVDTLRADHVGVYGYAGAATPAIDALAARGVLFETAIAPAPLTGPSHASILTGLTPLRHGFRNNSGFALAPSIRTAAEEFKAAGYRTAAFVSAFPLDRRFGFARGFDRYDDRLPRGHDPRRPPYIERPADATTDAVLRWLAEPASSGAEGAAPWFLWVHYYDPHAPYEPPPDLAPRFAQQPYDGEIAHVDRQLHRLLEQIDAGRSIVLVTADHGESLGEHGEGTHGIFVYDATIRVPWVMAGPGVPVARVAATVARSIDVLPTLSDYAGLGPRNGIEGRSLKPAAEGRRMPDAPAYAESLYPELELGWAPLHAWRTATHKFIKAPRPELYDLRQDAHETRDRAAADPALIAELDTTLAQALKQPAPAAAATAADPETMKRLQALGYLSGGAVRTPGVAPRDPKDGVRVLPQLNRGMSTARSEPDAAIRDLSAVLAQDPGLLMARRTRAVAYAAAKRHDLAIADLQLLDKERLLTPEDEVVLGDNLRAAGRLPEAARVLERATRRNPDFVQPLISLAEVRIDEQRYDEAAAACERALVLVPDHIEALRRLGDLALRRGDAAAAATRYARIVELDAGDVPALTNLGVARMRTGQRDEAERLFRQAIARQPTNADALLYLAGVLASAQRAADALPWFERAVTANPKSTMALNGLGMTRAALGDSRGAAAAFRQSLRVDASQPDIARTLDELGSRR